jgi:hypothetical protein
MRWYVEISALGVKPGTTTTLCVEAPQWQPALQKARALRGDEGPLGNFSIELLEDGFRAIDPVSRLRYLVRRAPDDASLTNTAPGDGPAPAAKASPVVAVKEETPDPEIPPPPKARAMAQTIAYTSEGAAMVAESVRSPALAPPPEPAPATPPPEPVAATPIAASGVRTRKAAQTIAYSSVGSAAVLEAAAAIENSRAAPPAAAAPVVAAPTVAAPTVAAPTVEAAPPEPPAPEEAPAPEEPGLPSYTLVNEREDKPSERSPLSYREIVYAVEPGTSDDDAKRLILDRFESVRQSLEQARLGKLINLAIFDHVFQGRPQRRPLVTLTWKDWKNEPPELHFPARDGVSVPPPAVTAGPSLAPPPASDSAPATVKMPSVSPAAPAAAKAPASSKSSSAPASSPAKSTRAAAVTPSTPLRAVPQKRLAGEDLLTELFEAFNDLHFLRDSIEGAEFVLALTLEKLPSEVGLVSLFDINKREFVVVRQKGGRRIVGHRQPERSPLAGSAMRKRHAVVLRDAEEVKGAADDRFTAIGVELRSVVCAPVELGGRTLGLIELVNPLDGSLFNEGDGNALTYIGQQFAEFAASRGVMIDPEQLKEGAAPKSTPASSKRR